MKIAIITLHSLTNPGSALQAYALQNFLTESGKDTVLIDYNPYYYFTGKRKIRTVVGKLLNWKEYCKREKHFAEFRKEHMRVTAVRYRTSAALAKKTPDADVFITGSDQIWNPDYDCGRDDAFYLRFVNGKAKIAYAASLGKDKFTDEERNFICSRVRDFDFVSVRENSSKVFLEKSGIRDVSYVCDPTLLINASQYKSFAKLPEGLPEKYILVYLVAQGELLDELIATVKKRYGVKVVQIGSFLKQCDCDIMLKDAGPAEFVGLIANAECVIASSYHATVFSLIFHKPFYIIPPRGNSARISQLLEVAGIDRRIIGCKSDISEKDNIDYDTVQKRLDTFIEGSKNVLLERLSQFETKSNNI